MKNNFTTTAMLIACILSGLVAGNALAGPNNSDAARIDFNRNWTFVKSAAEWPVEFNKDAKAMKPVILPHTWNAADMGPGLVAPYIGGGWYKKQFVAPQLQEGQRLLVEFEGVNNFHKVWVNGGCAGGRSGGFLASLYDITDLLREGENEILVRADNSYKLEAAMPRWIGWNRYGGITQPVWLHIREHAYIALAGVEIRTPVVSEESALTVVKTHIEETRRDGAKLRVRHTLMAPDGTVVSTTETSFTSRYSFTSSVEVELPEVKLPVLWSVTDPVLYTLHTELLDKDKVIDSQENRIGYRFYDFDPDNGFTLNGKSKKLRGANIHVFFPGLGNALPERFYREDVKLMKKMGCNFMRTSHYPRPETVLDACDELGILVMEEQPYWHGSVRPIGGEKAINNSSRLMRDMVRHHGNHPSIISWNTVNEIMIAPPYKPGVGFLPQGHPERNKWRINPRDYPYLRRHLKKMVETLEEVDPQRPVSMVVGGQWHKNDIAGLTSLADIVSYNGGALNFIGEEFIGPETGKRYMFRPDYFREVFPDRVHVMSEGVLNDYTFARGDWEKEQKGWRVSAKYWNVINQRPWFSGGAMWCFTDYTYLSPMVVDRFTDNSGFSHYDRHGVVDRHRLPKDLYYFYEAMWANHPVLHILGHWNHDEGSARQVVVFTNCNDVELTLNGKSLGKCVSSKSEFPYIENAPLIWKNVTFEKGTLKATGTYGGQKRTDTRVTEGDPANIRMSASNDIKADGRDISYVDLVITDEKGNRCYTATDSLSVHVHGAAMPLISNRIAADAGLARVAVRSNGKPGTIRITAVGKGLNDGEISLQAVEDSDTIIKT